jgi:Holliday junction resolvase YEN1
LGESLLDIASIEDEGTFQLMLKRWRGDLCRVLRSDPHGYLGKKYGALADNVPSMFPDPATVRAYAKPVTSWSDNENGPEYLSTHWQAVWQPDIAAIASFCEHKFDWGTESGILGKFHRVLWDGLCIKTLILVRCNNGCDCPCTKNV